MVIRTRIIVIGLQSSVLLGSAHKGPDPVLNVQQLNKAIALALSLYDTLRTSSEPEEASSGAANEEEVWRYFLLLGLENEPQHGAERLNDFLCKCPRWVRFYFSSSCLRPTAVTQYAPLSLHLCGQNNAATPLCSARHFPHARLCSRQLCCVCDWRRTRLGAGAVAGLQAWRD